MKFRYAQPCGRIRGRSSAHLPIAAFERNDPRSGVWGITLLHCLSAGESGLHATTQDALSWRPAADLQPGRAAIRAQSMDGAFKLAAGAGRPAGCVTPGRWRIAEPAR